jgi:hypothetical protein
MKSVPVLKARMGKLIGTHIDKPWLIFIEMGSDAGCNSLPWSWRTKAEGMPTFRKVCKHLRQSGSLVNFATRLAIDAIDRESKTEQPPT